MPTTKHDSRVQTAFKPPLTAIESMESCRQSSDHLDMQPSLTQAESSGPQAHQSTSRRLPRLFNFRELFSGRLSTGSTGSSGRRRRLQPINSHLERHKNSGGGSSSNGSKLGTLGSGFYSLTRAPSLGWKAAVRLMQQQQQQQQQQIDDAAGVAAALSCPAQDSLTPAAAATVSAALSGVSDVTDTEIRRVNEEYAALLLVVVSHLACLTQVGLQNFLGSLVMAHCSIAHVAADVVIAVAADAGPVVPEHIRVPCCLAAAEGINCLSCCALLVSFLLHLLPLSRGPAACCCRWCWTLLRWRQ